MTTYQHPAHALYTLTEARIVATLKQMHALPNANITDEELEHYLADPFAANFVDVGFRWNDADINHRAKTITF